MSEIEAISHMTFIVKDLDKATAFFKEIFGAQEVYASGAKEFSTSAEKFFLIGEIWIVIMQGEPLPTKTYNHIAFKIEEEDFDSYYRKVEARGLEIKRGVLEFLEKQTHFIFMILTIIYLSFTQEPYQSDWSVINKAKKIVFKNRRLCYNNDNKYRLRW